METLNVNQGETVIKQGDKAEGPGASFYIIESGTFTVVVNNSEVSKLTSGKSFGELALLHNTPRAATIVADTPARLFQLGRDAFRYIVASSQEKRTKMIYETVKKQKTFAELTEKQLRRVVDAVEIVIYPKGTKVITKGDTQNVNMFYMIKEGTAIVTDLGDGFQSTRLNPGEYFGERALMTGEPRAATVTAETELVCLVLDRENFNSLLGPLMDLLEHNLSLRVIESISLFANLTDTEKHTLSSSLKGNTKIFLPGEEIIKEGTPGNEFFIVKEGVATVTKRNIPGSTDITRGKYFGEHALREDCPREATITAKTKCECFILSRPEFDRLINNKTLVSVMDREIAEREELHIGEGKCISDAKDAQLKYALSDLRELAVLGSGTFGKVTLVQDKKDKTKVYALKAMLKSEIVAHKQQSNVMNEKNVMIVCHHPFILRLYQTFKDAKRLYMLIEFVQGGELFSVLHTPSSDGVPEAQAKFYAAGVLLGLAYLHSKDIAYRDMKPENCLVDRDGYPKLVDFGFAKVISNKSFTLCGTPEYLAPELVLGKGHNKCVDYWAFGILIYEMVVGYSPFSDRDGMDQVVICRNIVNGNITFPSSFNKVLKELIVGLLKRDTNARLGNLKGGTDDIRDHKWFAAFDFNAYLLKQIKPMWKPKVKDATDVSNFDAFGLDEHPETPYKDTSNWDKDF